MRLWLIRLSKVSLLNNLGLHIPLMKPQVDPLIILLCCSNFICMAIAMAFGPLINYTRLVWSMLKPGGCSKGFKLGMGHRSNPLAQYRLGIFFPELTTLLKNYRIWDQSFSNYLYWSYWNLRWFNFFLFVLLVIELGWTPEKMKTWWNRVMVQTKKPNTFEEEQDEQGTENT